ncbi:MAG: ABC transporter ATP-binding protein [Candidatus Scalindua sp.]|jgi:lipoprotein-releasing system ATP-binding protein|nr:ABC transporter ATP-binding protein [Candidatus Scalindua sp.]MBT5304448.1 ABC transporter ATP-binding protein [Candidatus Scalindua sp.]MBT6049736.1 ABC transporter ATP-binding protein [Candidatus Scalindua sp.]MBT6227045.1 ABC transporter ATP-binding protein [Candidatus Scalindua sp.]MBT6563745.1 ABC transporter ATP-binding protein [Candidatus Scalindua sp.]
MLEEIDNGYLCANEIRKEYKIGKTSVRVLNGVNLDVKKGEILIILGASGAGKSSLLHILGILDTPTTGHVSFKGENLSVIGQKKLAEKRNRIFGFVFQFYHLLPDFNALENVLMPRLIGRRFFKTTSKKEHTEKAIQLLDRVGLKDRINHRPNELSGGEKQRVAIVRALMNEPEILLCDEPTGNLDTKSGSEIQKLIWELNEKTKQTVVIVTHDERFTKLASRVVRMADGKIIDYSSN